jgi:hypothetical protein
LALQPINVGSAPNDGTGDPIRTAWQKTNENFAELYDRGLADLSDVDIADSPGPSDGDVLTYDASSSPPAWIALPPAGGGVSLAAHNTWTGKQDLTAGGDLTPAAAPSTTAIGYLGAPQNLGLDSGNVTLAITDAGKHVYHTDGNARDLTIPANGSVAFPIGTVLAGVNENGAGVVTLKITTDTLRWGSSTGQRSIAANGTFSLLKVAATVWRLTGDGIS